MHETTRELEEKHTKLEDSYKILEGRHERLFRKYLQTYTEKLGYKSDESTIKSFDELVALLLEEAVSADLLRGQVQSLQNILLSRIDRTNAVSDKPFIRRLRALASSIRSASRLIQPPGQCNVTEIFGQRFLIIGVEPHH
jgi:hypothetical protein